MTTLQLRVDTPVVECGGVVRGGLSWSVDGNHRGVRVEVGWHTEGRGTPEKKVVAVQEMPAEAQGAVLFQLPIPPEGPITVNGQLIRVIWEVRLVVDRALQGDDREKATITVFPRGGLALWAQRHAGPPTPAGM
jgi:hypothetical protein